MSKLRHMRRDPRSTMTAAHRAIFDKFVRDPSRAKTEDIPAAVLHALEDHYRPTGGLHPVSEEQLMLRSDVVVPDGDLLSAADAARMLGINLNAFARSVGREVEPLFVERRTLYRRTDIEEWRRKRSATKPPRPGTG